MQVRGQDGDGRVRDGDAIAIIQGAGTCVFAGFSEIRRERVLVYASLRNDHRAATEGALACCPVFSILCLLQQK